jgi:hypothetical protein
MTTVLEEVEGSASRPGRSLPPGKTRYPLYRRLGGSQGWSGTGVENLAPSTRLRSPDRPARSQSLYRLCYPAHLQYRVTYKNNKDAQLCSFLSVSRTAWVRLATGNNGLLLDTTNFGDRKINEYAVSVRNNSRRNFNITSRATMRCHIISAVNRLFPVQFLVCIDCITHMPQVDLTGALQNALPSVKLRCK